VTVRNWAASIAELLVVGVWSWDVFFPDTEREPKGEGNPKTEERPKAPKKCRSPKKTRNAAGLREVGFWRAEIVRAARVWGRGSFSILGRFRL
jgi:hypothetical protein